MSPPKRILHPKTSPLLQWMKHRSLRQKCHLCHTEHIVQQLLSAKSSFFSFSFSLFAIISLYWSFIYKLSQSACLRTRRVRDCDLCTHTLEQANLSQPPNASNPSIQKLIGYQIQQSFADFNATGSIYCPSKRSGPISNVGHALATAECRPL